MGMISCGTNPKEIIEIINSKAFNDFHLGIKEELGILDLVYSIEIENYRKDQDGYGDERILTSMLPDSKWRNTKSVIVYTETISEYINRSFSRIYIERTFRKTVDICVRFLLVHELTHVLQINQGRLTKEIFEGSNKIPYEKRDFEMEADLKAIEIMEGYGDFTLEICNLVKLRRSLDNDSVQILIKSSEIDGYY